MRNFPRKTRGFKIATSHDHRAVTRADAMKSCPLSCAPLSAHDATDAFDSKNGLKNPLKSVASLAVRCKCLRGRECRSIVCDRQKRKQPSCGSSIARALTACLLWLTSRSISRVTWLVIAKCDCPVPAASQPRVWLCKEDLRWPRRKRRKGKL